MATLSAPEQELSNNLFKQEDGRYVVRCRRNRSKDEDAVAAQLIKDLCAREHLDVNQLTHIATSISEKHWHYAFVYGDLDNTLATIHVFKGKRTKRIFATPSMITYINRRFNEWIQLKEIENPYPWQKFPIKQEVFPAGSTDPRAPQNLIRTTGSAVPRLIPPTKEEDTTT